MAAVWATHLGDGFALAAGPLLVASQTHDPFLVALASLLQQLPLLLFALSAGVVADRVDRRLLVVTANLFRVAVLLVLTTTLVTGHVGVPVVLTAMFLLGVGETFEQVTGNALAPMLVGHADLGVANSRLMAGILVAGQLVGPPVGASLFAVAVPVPFPTQAALVALGAVLVSRVTGLSAARLSGHDRTASSTSPSSERAGRVRAEVAEGFRWLWHHAAVRTLAVTILAFNVTFGAAWSVLVLYAIQRLQLGAVGYGLLTTSAAVGGLAGIACYGWISHRVSLANIMRVGLVIETLTHVTLALTTTPWLAMGTFFVFGAHAFIWGTTSNVVRQRAVPTEFQGRVSAVYQIGVYGGMVVGGGIGGLVARTWGVTAPFWFAFAGSVVILTLIWRQLGHIAHD